MMIEQSRAHPRSHEPEQCDRQDANSGQWNDNLHQHLHKRGAVNARRFFELEEREQPAHQPRGDWYVERGMIDQSQQVVVQPSAVTTK